MPDERDAKPPTASRIGAAEAVWRLRRIAEALNLPIEAFFGPPPTDDTCASDLPHDTEPDE